MTITLILENDAMKDPREVARILRELADNIAVGNQVIGLNLRDINGNPVGYVCKLP
jgi:hypothetical protein